jgi:predicted helicase
VRVADFVDSARSDVECAEAFNLPLRDRDCWDLARARSHLDGAVCPSAVQPYAYRPLDTRSIYHNPRLIARPNRRVMRHLDGHPENLALVVGRQGAATGSAVWDVAFVAAGLIDQNLYRRGGACVFPLYLYADDSSHDAGSSGTPRANLAPEFVAGLFGKLRMTWIPDGHGDLIATFGPQDVLAYIYALLFAPSFRTLHADALRTDFPRIPLPRDPETFRALCALGDQLVTLHLAKRQPVVMACLQGTGDCRVERVSYMPGRPRGEPGAVAINATQRFEGVSREVWELTIGGHRVAQKWLLDRRGRELSGDDVQRYRQVVGVLKETHDLMGRIDEFSSCGRRR